jgi:hypothetical protein
MSTYAGCAFDICERLTKWGGLKQFLFEFTLDSVTGNSDNFLHGPMCSNAGATRLIR